MIHIAIMEGQLKMYLHGSWGETFPEIGDVHLGMFRPEI